MSVADALNAFVDAYVLSYPETSAPYDLEWQSPCEIGQPFAAADGTRCIRWRPLARASATVADDFAPLERALECTVHADVKAYYAGYWSGALEAEAVDGPLSLILLWNVPDIARLNENLLGHAFAKRQARAPLTIFFACTEPDSDLFLSVHNDTGVVLLERPGERPLREVAASLGEFLDGLVPAPPRPLA